METLIMKYSCLAKHKYPGVFHMTIEKQVIHI